MTKQSYNSFMKDMVDISRELDLSHADYFRGTHRGLTFKVSRHNGTDYSTDRHHNCWCYYIFLCRHNFSDAEWLEVFRDPNVYDKDNGTKRTSYSSPKLDDCEFHGGITFFGVTVDPATPEQINLEVGCDYNHLWDSEAGHPYRIEGVMADAKRTIDNIHDMFSLKLWSRIDGSYHLEKDLVAYNEKKMAS